MPTAKEIEALRRRLKAEADRDHQKRTSDAKLAAYRKKSDAKIPKSNASKRDAYSQGSRMAGAGFSKS